MSISESSGSFGREIPNQVKEKPSYRGERYFARGLACASIYEILFLLTDYVTLQAQDLAGLKKDVDMMERYLKDMKEDHFIDPVVNQERLFSSFTVQGDYLRTCIQQAEESFTQGNNFPVSEYVVFVPALEDIHVTMDADFVAARAEGIDQSSDAQEQTDFAQWMEHPTAYYKEHIQEQQARIGALEMALISQTDEQEFQKQTKDFAFSFDFGIHGAARHLFFAIFKQAERIGFSTAFSNKLDREASEGLWNIYMQSLWKMRNICLNEPLNREAFQRTMERLKESIVLVNRLMEHIEQAQAWLAERARR